MLVGHEKVPHGFGLTGDCGGDTADGARSLNHRLLLLFLRYGTPDWAKGRMGTSVIVSTIKIKKKYFSEQKIENFINLTVCG